MRSKSFVLNELANSPYDYYLVNKVTSKEFPGAIEYQYEFVTDKKITYGMTLRITKKLFQPGKTVWIGFGTQEGDPQGEGDQFRVLSTVLTILKNFLSLIDDPAVDQVSFNFDDLRRQKFYSRFVNNISRYLPGWQLKDQGANWFSLKPIENISESSIEGLLIDLTQNFQNYRSLVGRIIGQDNKGKIRIEVVAGDPKPGAKSTVTVGTILKISPNYLKQAKVLSKDNLLEVKSSPGELRKWAASQDAKQVTVGFELEMIFPDTPDADNDEAELIPDYSQNESVDDIDSVLDFFSGGEDSLSLGYRESERLRRQMEAEYKDWLRDEADGEFGYEEFYEWMYENKRDELLYDLRDEVADEYELDLQSDSEEIDKIAEEKFEDLIKQSWDDQDEHYDEAFDEFLEDFREEKPESEWFEDGGMSTMRDIASAYNLEWPYVEEDSQDDYRESWNALGQSLSRALGGVGVKISGSHHGTGRDMTSWILEYDSSITPDNASDAGIEIISPPMPLDEGLRKLDRALDWAQETGAYTNSSTGLHMNISTMRSGIDYVKLVLFMGDQYVLEKFGREANSFTKSAIKILKDRIDYAKKRVNEAESVYVKPVDIAAAMDLMRKNLIELASRYVQEGTGSDKYTSAHIRHTRSGHTFIEFRGPGNDYLGKRSENEGVIDDTVLRLARAMVIAGEPSYERKEYGKKLYKLLSDIRFKPDEQGKTDTGDVEIDDAITRIFADYSSGILNPTDTKRRWAKEVLEKYRSDRIQGVGDAIEWEVFVPTTNQVIDRFTAKNDAEAIEKAQLGHSGKGYDYRVRPADGQMTKRQELAKKILSKPQIYYVAPSEFGMNQKGFYVNAAGDQQALEKGRKRAGDAWRGISLHNIQVLPIGIKSNISIYTVSYPGTDLEVDVYADTPENAIKVARHETFRTREYGDEKFVVKLSKKNAQVSSVNSPMIQDPTQELERSTRPSAIDINMPGPGESDFLVTWDEMRQHEGREVRVSDAIRIVARSAAEAYRRVHQSLQMQGRDAFNVNAEPTDPPAWRRNRTMPAAATGNITNPVHQDEGEWTGQWLVVDREGQEVHRFHGIGNVQSDANRHAQTWLLSQGDRMDDRGPFNVVPEMRHESRPVDDWAPYSGEEEWSGRWLVQSTVTGETVHIISGIGNSQDDADRHAERWVQSTGFDDPIEVVPEMER